jgi:hypothetical protein
VTTQATALDAHRERNSGTGASIPLSPRGRALSLLACPGQRALGLHGQGGDQAGG